MVLLKMFSANRYQNIEEEFNAWTKGVDPRIVKTFLAVESSPKSEGGNSLTFTLAVFFVPFYHVEKEESNQGRGI